MPASSKRADTKSNGTRRQGARPAGRWRARKETTQARRISFSRRIGVAAALVLLIGAGLALASGTFNGPTRRGEPPPSVTPPPALTLTQPDPAVTNVATIDVAGVLPPGLDRSTTNQLRVYVNAQLVRQRNIPGEDNFTIGVSRWRKARTRSLLPLWATAVRLSRPRR